MDICMRETVGGREETDYISDARTVQPPFTKHWEGRTNWIATRSPPPSPHHYSLRGSGRALTCHLCAHRRDTRLHLSVHSHRGPVSCGLHEAVWTVRTERACPTGGRTNTTRNTNSRWIDRSAANSSPPSIDRLRLN